MLNVTPIRGNNQYAAARYFSAADDYYAKETPGEWQGEGAERLGLVGPVDQLQLAKLLQMPDGAHPLGVLCLGPVDAYYAAPMLQQEKWACRAPLEDMLMDDVWDATRVVPNNAAATATKGKTGT